jgi:predicted ferric reductase
MLAFLMFIINGMALVTIVLMSFTFETWQAIPNMVIIFVIVMAINYVVTEPMRRSLTKREELQRKLFEKKMKRNAASSVKDTGWYVVK